MARVVVAEDELHILRLVGMWLRQNGHDVIEVRSGTLALEAVRRHVPDALVTDVNMPGLDGLRLVEQVAADADHPAVIILLSSRCDLPDLEARHPGISILCHPKPFSPSRLVSDLERVLGTSTGQTPSPAPVVPGSGRPEADA